MSGKLFYLFFFLIKSEGNNRTQPSKSPVKYNWDYERQEDWAQVSPGCAGYNQSPIDIQDICRTAHLNTTTRLDRNLRLRLSNYNRRFAANDVILRNNGHTAQVSIRSAQMRNSRAPRVSGSAVGNEKYQFFQLHFHWHRV